MPIGGGAQPAGGHGHGHHGQHHQNPAVPFKEHLHGFGENKKLTITGIPNGQGFVVNFHTPQDLAFHFNPRFDENVVVRNSTHHGGWQNEERFQKNFPFYPGQTFTLEFVSSPGEVIVNFNGEFFTSFSNRLDMNQVHQIEISGGIDLTSVHIS